MGNNMGQINAQQAVPSRLCKIQPNFYLGWLKNCSKPC